MAHGGASNFLFLDGHAKAADKPGVAEIGVSMSQKQDGGYGGDPYAEVYTQEGRLVSTP
jgi:prepilin-type processing-associated H-X9-DG protein